ncbi:hypothetical protein MTR_8g470090 [Medicago truncatula]|uniref:Uncharacterized protein n=1 Tax=Medicago truncatula TaxID=3880 RepID=A0A072TR96_MEDTR|nr:hypothetical protein MTR_8g470090 [Medicago truncatula]
MWVLPPLSAYSILMANNASTNILRSLIEKEKLTETNFLDWFRNMRIVLTHEKWHLLFLNVNP